MSDLIKAWGAVALVTVVGLLFVLPAAAFYTVLVGWSWSSFLVVWFLSVVGVPILVCLVSVPVAGPPGTHATRRSPYLWPLIAALALPFGIKIASLWCASMGWFETASHLWSLRWPSLPIALAVLLTWPLVRLGYRLATDYGWYPFWLGWHLARSRWGR
jgi:hypothetical protein